MGLENLAYTHLVLDDVVGHLNKNVFSHFNHFSVFWFLILLIVVVFVLILALLILLLHLLFDVGWGRVVSRPLLVVVRVLIRLHVFTLVPAFPIVLLDLIDFRILTV